MELNRTSFREEVNRFRAGMETDALNTAEKSITLEKRGQVGIIWFDQFQEKANKLSSPNLLRFFELLTEVEKSKELGALVLLSKKPTIFIAGADIAEIKKLASGEQTVESLMKLQSIFTYLEKLPIPTVAAIHGACMGGGTELTLACDYRMASDGKETKIALPEVMLGVLPGWGGTQRLPRLVGLEKSLDLILSGRSVDGKSAKKMGLVDKLVPQEMLEQKAVDWANELAKSKKKRRHESHWKERFLEVIPGGKMVIFDQAKKMLMSKTKGNYPAPLRALEVIKKTYGGALDSGLREEAKAFAELVVTPESKNLIRIYYLNEKVKKDKGTTAGVAGIAVKKAAVLGAGVMGGGIAQLFAAKGIRVRLKDISWDAVAKGYKAAHKIFEKLVKRRKMKPSELQNKMALIEGSTEFTGFKNTDVVVEAIVENLDVKKKVFQELEAYVSDKTVIATNTSSLSVTAITELMKKPQRGVGMHFFNPVDKMPLVEVIAGKHSSDEAVATIFQLTKQLGKTPIVVKDSPGFVVNRILGPYLNEAVYLMAEGVDVTRIDAVIEKFGMPMGPCTLLDEVGLDVGAKVSKILQSAFGERMKAPPLMEKATEGNRYGRKTGKGIYLYEDGGKKKVVDSGLKARLGITGDGKSVTDEEIQKRCIYLMVNEAARCIEENLVRDISDIDVGMIYGTGFAPFRGGVLRYADETGIGNIVGDLEIFSRNLGMRFKPATYLQQLAVSGKNFYEN